MATLFVDKIDPQSGTALEIGTSGDTVNLGAGVTAGFGKILQVVTATDSTSRNTTSTSYVTASNTLSVDITPSATSSKIYVVVTGTMYWNTLNKRGYATIYRDAGNLAGADGMMQIFDPDSGILGTMGMSILDSPSSTSALTYQVYIKAMSGGTVYINEYLTKGSITAFEVAG